MLNDRKKIYPKKDLNKVLNDIHQLNKPSKLDVYLNASTNNSFRSNTFGESDYDKSLNLVTDIDTTNENTVNFSINEHRANEQSGLTQLAALPFRAAAKAATEVSKLVPIIYGVGKAIFEDNETSALSDIFNNEGVKMLDEMNEKINTDLLPIYVKDSVKNGTLMDNLLSTSFYATEGADGIGFMSSMFVPGMILTKFALGAKLIRGLSKISKMTKMVEGTEGSVQVLKGLGWTGRALDSKISVLGNSLLEAGAESKGVEDSLISEKNSEIQKYISSGYTEEDANIIFNQNHPDWDNSVAEAMKGDFWTQLPILLGTGSMMQKAIFGKTLDKVEKTVEYGLKDRVYSIGKQYGKALMTEGFLEEGGQSTLERYYTKKALNGDLKNGWLNSLNRKDLTAEYINTLSTVDGQKAVFLGALLGGPFMSAEARKEYKKGLKDTNSITNGINSTIDDYSAIHENEIYEKDPKNTDKFLFKKDENGNLTTEKVLNRQKAFEVAKALKNTEEDNELYDDAIKNDDIKLQEFIKNKNILKLIAPAIQNGELGIEILKEQLEQSSKFTDILEGDKNSKDKTKTSNYLISEILEKAKHLQKQNEKFKDFASDVIKLDDPRITKEVNEAYLNHLNSKYIETKSLQYDSENQLRELIKKRTDLLGEFGYNEFNLTDDLSSEDERLVIKERTSPILKKINDGIRQTEKEISKQKQDINDFWDNKNELINKNFKKYIDALEIVKKNSSSEVVEKAEEISQTIKNATTVEELSNLPKTGTNTDKILEEQAEAKRVELKKIKEDEETELVENAKQDDIDFNGASKTDVYSTEGSDLYNELTPVVGENVTPNEKKEGNAIEPTNGLGVKLISYNREKGFVFGWIEEQFANGLAFERNPTNKKGIEVGFEINQDPIVGGDVKEALDKFNNGDLSDITLITEYLPINIKLANGAYLPIETRRDNGEINPETETLRKNLITNILNGNSIENMFSTITGQYNGVLQVEESPNTENSILELGGVNGMKYIRENLYVVNIHGQLENVIDSNIVRNFQGKFTKNLDRSKINAAGEIYLIIPKADGSLFPLKLNIGKLKLDEAGVLFEIYKEFLTEDKSSNTTLSEVTTALLTKIEDTFGKELDVITLSKNKKDVTLGEIVDLLVYESNNVKSRIKVEDGVLYFGDNAANSENIDLFREDIIEFLTTQKRHQIKTRPKTVTDNERTNLSSTSAHYIKYLIDNNILTTNAVVDKPAFQGYTNLFISTEVRTKKHVEIKPEIKSKKVRPVTVIKERVEGTRTIEELTEGLKSITKEEQIQYKELIDTHIDYLLTLKNNKPKQSMDELLASIEYGSDIASDQGALIPKKNFEGLNFGENKEKATFKKGSLIGNVYTLKNNEKYTLNIIDGINGEIKSIDDSKNKDRLSFSIRNQNNENIGNITFWKDNDGLYYSNNTNINKEYQRKGLATVTYDYAEKLGIIIKPSNVQTKMGKSFFNTRIERKSNPNFNPENIIDIETFDYKTGDSTVILNNNSQNNRNSENNLVSLPKSNTVVKDLSDPNKFVSSSDIPNTVENKKQMEKQKDVFKAAIDKNEKKNHIRQMEILYKMDKNTMSKGQLEKLENFKNAYPKEYEKNCR